MATLINFATQQLLKPISVNNENKFTQVMTETEVKDLQPLLGESLYQDLIQNASDAKYVTLLGGVEWELSGKTYKMSGLKYVLAYFFFANYYNEGQIADTFSGPVTHRFDESNPIEFKDKMQIISQTREIASRYWEEVKLYIENNLDTYTEWMADGEKVFSPKIERLDLIDTHNGRCPTTGKRFITE